MKNIHTVWAANRLFLATLILVNLTVLLPPASILRVMGAFLLVAVLSGLGWSRMLLGSQSPLLRWTVASAISYIITCLSLLMLHNQPGPVQGWQLLLSLNLFALLPLMWGDEPAAQIKPHLPDRLTRWGVSLILLIGLVLRLTQLGYSEFQGDEALAMLSAAEALSGHEDALFLRSKGPAEVLLPMALWALTGTINETIARLPFTLAAMMSIVTLFLLGLQVTDKKSHSHVVGLLAAGIFSMSGFMVAFGRIVQYQAIVVWMSCLAFLLLCHWQKTRQKRLIFLSGLSLGAGFLAHYDAVLALPAVGWLLFAQPADPQAMLKTDTDTGRNVGSGKLPQPHLSLSNPTLPELVEGGRRIFYIQRLIGHGLLFAIGFALTTLPFYLPYSLDPQVSRTGAYVGQRVGNELRNNLPQFFHFNAFYSSFQYIFFTSLCVLGLISWLLWQQRQRYKLGAAITLTVSAMVIMVALNPTSLQTTRLDFSMLPFAWLLLMVWFILPMASPQQGLIVWLAVPFLFYNFVVALGLTHIYTIVPAWSLLAALGLSELGAWSLAVLPKLRAMRRFMAALYTLLLIAWLLGCVIFLANAFLRTDVAYWQDYPAGNLSLFWTPYEQPPSAGFFGFVHRAGWKAIGQQLIMGHFQGDYGSNEEPDVTTWYTRGAPRACDPQPEFYFFADDLIDPQPLSAETIETIDQTYQPIAEIATPNGKLMTVKQLVPTTLPFRQLDEVALARQFDQTAYPQMFARSVGDVTPIAVNFGHLIQLTGYQLDQQRTYPGGRIPVTLYWQALTDIPDSYQVFVHLIHASNGLIAQADGLPVCWSYPTNLWRPQQIIADQHAIDLPADAPLGDYRLEVGLYLPQTFQRLDWLDVAGNPGGVSFELTTVRLRQ